MVLSVDFKGEEQMFKVRLNHHLYSAVAFFAILSSTLCATQLLDRLNLKENTNSDIKPTDVILWSVVNVQSYQDGFTAVYLNLTTKDNFSIYNNHLSFEQDEGWLLTDSIYPPTKTIKDPLTKKTVRVLDKGQFVILFQGFEQYNKSEFTFKVTFLGCTSKLCLFPYTQVFKVPNITIPSALPQDLVDNFKEDNTDSKAALSTTTPSKPNNLPFEEYLANILSDDSQLGLLLILAIALLGGLLTNLTPCVYPMIPITLRLLGKETSRPFLASCSYAGGIVASYTSLGFFAVSTGALFGQIMASTTFNLVVSILMFCLAWTMLGFGKFSKLQTVGTKISSHKKGLLNTFFMGIGAGLIASPCTGPILASLLTYAVTLENTNEALFIILTYSIGFGLPYIVLGRLASTLVHIRLPGFLQSTVKIVFAGIMFALAFYYLRIPLYEIHKSLINDWQNILLVSTLLAIFLFLLVPFMRSSWNKYFVILPTMLVGFSLFASTQWFLALGTSKSRNKLAWISQEKQALELARKTEAPLLIDVWAEWCESCKKMDLTTFSDDLVIKELKKNSWVLLKLDLTLSNDYTEKLRKKYKVTGLPTVIIKHPSKSEQLALNGFVSTQTLFEHIRKFSKEST